MQYRRAKIAGASYFFTIVTYERCPIFGNAETVALFQTALNRIKDRHPFEVDAFVILLDHIHTIWTLPEGDAAFSKRWRLIKEAFTKPFVRQHQSSEPNASRRAKGEQAVWQRRFWEHVIRDDTDYAAHVDYIHYNPVRHGLVSAARGWPHSSFSGWVERGIYEPCWGSDDMPPVPEWAVRGE
jgi:putative transposase